MVRGIHPPVLADRGLEGAIRALALDMAVPVEVIGELTGRPPAPVESAVYFAVAECLVGPADEHPHGRRVGGKPEFLPRAPGLPQHRETLVGPARRQRHAPGRLGREPAAGLGDAQSALKIVENVYRESGYDHRA